MNLGTRHIFLVLILLMAKLGLSQRPLLIPFYDSTGHNWGYVDTARQWVIKPEYASCNEFYKGRAVVVNKEQQYALIDSSGKNLTGFVFDNIYELDEDVVTARKNGKEGWLHYTGKELSSFSYSWISHYTGGIVPFQLHGYTGYINGRGKIVIPPKFKCLILFDEESLSSEFEDEVTFVCNEKKRALFDSSGKQITKFIYEASSRFWNSRFINGVCPVSLNKKEIFINKAGKPVKYDSVSYVRALMHEDSLLENKRAENEKTDAWPKPDKSELKTKNTRVYGYVFKKYLNADSTIAFENADGFKHHGSFVNGMMKVEKSGKTAYVNTQGKYIVPPVFGMVSEAKAGLFKVWKKKENHGFVQIGFVDITGRQYLWGSP